MTRQQREALDRANERRLELAALRRLVGERRHVEGRQMVAAILREPAGIQQRAKVNYLLDSIFRFGPTRRGRLIRKVGIAAARFDRPLAELSSCERRLIADHLEDPGLPARDVSFNGEELALIEAVFGRLGARVGGARGEMLRSLAAKASHNLGGDAQQTVGHGQPLPTPTLVRARNGRSDVAAGATDHSSPAPAVDLRRAA